MRFLVLLAFMFLIVVDSSTPIMPLAPNFLPSHVRASTPLTVDSASMFMTKKVMPSKGCATERISLSCVALGELTQRIVRWGMLSEKCSGISLETQLR